ncbi:hypothetical protein JAAARDRAFT_194120 [Jaapia argillacea MUCL 33604]|uniref:Uncharacterized protein n=1 Tax=Jaapia argillacea MUCL 33604 TaxID=933084 RepID=A0A067PVH4_9AGAM|nr:hypothetical protein JAAARDRAFT_194120 [Jaapia argillacea MUCL 33604]
MAEVMKSLVETLRGDPVVWKMWLEMRVKEIKDIMMKSGLQELLDQLKEDLRPQQVVISYLRSLRRLILDPHTEDTMVEYEEKEYYSTAEQAAPHGDEREKQLGQIVARARYLQSIGADPDPNCIVPVGMDPTGDDFANHFQNLDAGKHLKNSAKSKGRSEVGMANWEANRGYLAQWNRDHAAERLLRSLQHLEMEAQERHYLAAPLDLSNHAWLVNFGRPGEPRGMWLMDFW